jgi:hypothetical protein
LVEPVHAPALGGDRALKVCGRGQESIVRAQPEHAVASERCELGARLPLGWLHALQDSPELGASDQVDHGRVAAQVDDMEPRLGRLDGKGSLGEENPREPLAVVGTAGEPLPALDKNERARLRLGPRPRANREVQLIGKDEVAVRTGCAATATHPRSQFVHEHRWGRSGTSGCARHGRGFVPRPRLDAPADIRQPTPTPQPTAQTDVRSASPRVARGSRPAYPMESP